MIIGSPQPLLFINIWDAMSYPRWPPSRSSTKSSQSNIADKKERVNKSTQGWIVYPCLSSYSYVGSELLVLNHSRRICCDGEPTKPLTWSKASVQLGCFAGLRTTLELSTIPTGSNHLLQRHSLDKIKPLLPCQIDTPCHICPQTSSTAKPITYGTPLLITTCEFPSISISVSTQLMFFLGNKHFHREYAMKFAWTLHSSAIRFKWRSKRGGWDWDGAYAVTCMFYQRLLMISTN